MQLELFTEEKINQVPDIIFKAIIKGKTEFKEFSKSLSTVSQIASSKELFIYCDLLREINTGRLFPPYRFEETYSCCYYCQQNGCRTRRSECIFEEWKEKIYDWYQVSEMMPLFHPCVIVENLSGEKHLSKYDSWKNQFCVISKTKEGAASEVPGLYFSDIKAWRYIKNREDYQFNFDKCSSYEEAIKLFLFRNAFRRSVITRRKNKNALQFLREDIGNE